MNVQAVSLNRPVEQGANKIDPTAEFTVLPRIRRFFHKHKHKYKHSDVLSIFLVSKKVMPLLLLPCRSISSFYSIQSEMHAHIGNKICRSNLFALSHCRCNEHVRASAITRISCSKKNTFLIWLLHICSILRGIFTFCEMTPI